MFRTRVIYLWLQMVGALIGLLLLAAVVAAMFDAAVTFPMVLALFFVSGLVALGIAIAGALPMLVLMQYFLIAAGTRAGKPADFRIFRRWLLRYGLVLAALPILAFGMLTVRKNAGLASTMLAAWALATMLVLACNARRLHREWEAGVPY